MQESESSYTRFTLPEAGFVRLKTILGDPKAKPPTIPIIPVSRTAWYDGVKSGKYPQPVKLSSKSVAWRWADIHALIAQISDGV